jgi:PKD repeat protein
MLSGRVSFAWRASRADGDRTRGQALVEFAIVAPVFMLLLLIAIDFGRLFYTYIDIHNGAREGAAYAGSAPSDMVGITAHVTNESIGQAQRGAGATTVSVACATAAGTALPCASATGGDGAGETVTVSVAKPFTFLTPVISGFFGGPLNVGAIATANVFGYAGDGGGVPPAECSAPTADFTIVNMGGRTVFVDPTRSRPNSGVCNISGYNWTWGDGKDDVGTATGDTHVYDRDGTYSIKLTVTNQGGDGTKSLSVTIGSPPPPAVCTKPTASFTFTSDKKNFTFRDTSTVTDPANCPITDWAWNFGDGTLGNAQNPSHTYPNSSEYTVTLIVTNAAGASAPYSHKQ